MYNLGFVRLLPQGEVFAWLELPCLIIVQIGIGIDKEVLMCDSLCGFIAVDYCHCEYACLEGLRKSFCGFGQSCISRDGSNSRTPSDAIKY
jgi:hypothetical protein